MRDIIVVALEQEAPALRAYSNVFFCGVGKINAAITTATLVERYRPQRVINFGTAGGITVGTGLHRVTRFVQRDMQCADLGVPVGVTPFGDTSVVLEIDPQGLTCSTGDNFVIDPNLEIPADLVDMESYAIARVCVRAGINFDCYKFVTDQANTDAYQDWNHMISAGQSHYIRVLDSLGITSRSTS
jgi:adenosylhomocysteine nucleosidase